MSESIPLRGIRYPGPLALFLIWTAIALLAYWRFYLQTTETGLHPHVWPECLYWFAYFYPWVVLSPVAFRVERRFPLAPPAWRNYGPLLLAGIVSAFAAVVLGNLIIMAAGFLLRQPLADPCGPWVFSARKISFDVLVFWCNIGGAFVIRRLMDLQRQEASNAQLALEKSRLETCLKEAELEALRMRLNPHFLFNTLQNVSVLAGEDPKTASQMLARLGDLLRVALKRDPRHEIPLEEEIGITESYLAVEKMRFRDRLTVRFDVAPGTENALVPSLLLQPLVENAITHGLRGRDQGTIAVSASREGDQLVLTVTDSGSGPPEQDLEVGTGLGSTCERLARLYPGEHELSIRKLSGGGAEARIALPFRTNGAPGSSPQHEQPATADCR